MNMIIILDDRYAMSKVHQMEMMMEIEKNREIERLKVEEEIKYQNKMKEIEKSIESSVEERIKYYKMDFYSNMEERMKTFFREILINVVPDVDVIQSNIKKSEELYQKRLNTEIDYTLLNEKEKLINKFKIKKEAIKSQYSKKELDLQEETTFQIRLYKEKLNNEYTDKFKDLEEIVGYIFELDDQIEYLKEKYYKLKK